MIPHIQVPVFRYEFEISDNSESFRPYIHSFRWLAWGPKEHIHVEKPPE